MNIWIKMYGRSLERDMKPVYGPILIVWLMVEQIVDFSTEIYGMASLFGALCLFNIKEKYFD